MRLLHFRSRRRNIWLYILWSLSERPVFIMHLICCPHSKVLTAEGGESEEGMKKGLTELVFILDRGGSLRERFLQKKIIICYNCIIKARRERIDDQYL